MQRGLQALSGAYPSPPPGAADGEPQALLAAKVPMIALDMAQDLAHRHFGIEGGIAALASERDANFCITLGDDLRVLLKITNDQESRAVTEMQTATLMHLAATAPDLPVQRIFATKSGAPDVEVAGMDGRKHIMRLVSFLDGTMLHKARPSAALHSEIGTTLGRLSLALRGFFHPAAGHVLQWDLKQAHLLWPMLSSIADGSLQDKVARVLQRFDEHVAPELPRLRSQIVHNDFNPYNLIVDGDARYVTGVIDFGDMVHTPLACDLAVACSYHLGAGEYPLDRACALIGGYHSALPLEEREVALLPDLIALRSAATLAITSWRAAKHPANSAYILRNAPASIRSLDALAAIGAEAAASRFRQALQSTPQGVRP